MIITRQEHYSDIETVNSIYQTTFPTTEEADQVDQLRKTNNVSLSLIAETHRTPVGHILFFPIRHENSSLKIVGLGPMAVRPQYQRRNIGTIMVKRGIECCRKQGVDAIVVHGHPEFYSRFGFLPTENFGLKPQWDHSPAESFMIKELQPGVLEHVSGTLKYSDAFSNIISS